MLKNLVDQNYFVNRYLYLTFKSQNPFYAFHEKTKKLAMLLSDVENVDIMLGSYSRDDEENNDSEDEVNSDSGSSRPPKKF